MFHPTHVHSEFSNLDGHGTCDEIAARIADLGIGGCGLTDHGLTAGWRPFGEAMRKRGLKPVYGLEGYQARLSRKRDPDPIEVKVTNKAGREQVKLKKPRDASHVVLLAQNDTGLRNIRLMSHYAHAEGFYYAPRVDWDLLERFNEGVIATSACLGGLVAAGIQKDDLSDLERYLQIFGDRFYLELHAYQDPLQYAVNEELVSIGRERGLPFIAASDAHYCQQEHYLIHETLLCIQYKQGLMDDKGDHACHDDRTLHHPDDLWLMDDASIRQRLSYLPSDVVDDSIANSQLVFEQCNAELEPIDGTLHLPRFDKTADNVEVKDPKDFLFELMDEGLQERYGDWMEQPEVAERAAFEFTAITEAFGPGERGLEEYFLITWDWVSWCHRNGILTGPGRGSAAGSILSYSLGITDVCPLKHGLFFERFWNPGRASGLPDIDVDVPQAARSKVKAYLARRWGAEHIRDLGTHVRLQPKSAIDNVMRALYLDPDTGKLDSQFYEDAATIKAIIDETEDAGQSAPWRSVYDDDGETVLKPGIFDLVGDKLEEWVEKYPEVFTLAEDLTGRINTYGRHPSAVIVSDIPLDGVLPGRYVFDKKTGEETTVTQIEMKEAEKLGYLKADILGLRNLDTLQAMLKHIPECEGLNPVDIMRSIDEDDPSGLSPDPGDRYHVDPVYSLLAEKKTLGLFQIENGHAARSIAYEMDPRSLGDLGAIVALNRPGPLRSGMVERYQARRRNEEPVVYRHEMLEPILSETYGDFLYQEAVLAYFAAIGYTLGEGDEIRRILGKKDVKAMGREHPRYLERATKFMTEGQAEAIWTDIIDFSKYAFNKAHSIAYGKILLWTMWAKYHYPTEYIMACIETSVDDGMERIGAFVNEGIRMGVTITTPDINRSEEHVSKQGDDIVFGLRVKGVSSEGVQWVMENRPFTSYEHMTDMLAEQSKVYSKTPADERPARSPKQRLGAGMCKALLNAGAFDHLHDELLHVVKRPFVNRNGREVMKDVVETCTLAERAAYEQELIGVTITDVWADTIAEWREDEGISDEEYASLCHYGDIEAGDGQQRQVIGVVCAVQKFIRDKDANFMPGKPWGFVTIEWRGESVRFAVWAQVWQKFAHAIKKGNLGVFTLKCEPRGPVLEKGIRIHGD